MNLTPEQHQQVLETDVPVERFDEEDHQANDDYGLPARLSDDGYYSRNDAGEYSWM